MTGRPRPEAAGRGRLLADKLGPALDGGSDRRVVDFPKSAESNSENFAAHLRPFAGDHTRMNLTNLTNLSNFNNIALMNSSKNSQALEAFDEIRESIKASRGTVGAFAMELRKDVTVLLEQLNAAGSPKEDANSRLTDEDKHKLLVYLQTSHGTSSNGRKRITLVKKVTNGRQQSTLSKVSKCRDDSRYKQGIINVGNLGSALPVLGHYEVLRYDCSTAKFSQGKVDYELLRAFRSINSRDPDNAELEELVGLSDRLNVHLAELPPGNPDNLLAALRNSQFKVAPRFSEVLLQTVFALIHYGRQGNELALTLFRAQYEAQRAQAIPVSQQGLHGGSCRSALAEIAIAAWRLLRLKHVLPVHVATISLA